MDEVALRSYDGGSRDQLTHNDRDKGGNKAHDLEASRNFYFSHFIQGTAFLLLSQSGLDKKQLWTKEHRWWHHLWKTRYMRCKKGTTHGPQGKHGVEVFHIELTNIVGFHSKSWD